MHYNITASRICSQAMHYMKARLEPIVREGALAGVHVVQPSLRLQGCEGHHLGCRALRPHHGRQWAPGFASPRSLHLSLHHHPRLDVKACEIFGSKSLLSYQQWTDSLANRCRVTPAVSCRRCG